MEATSIITYLGSNLLWLTGKTDVGFSKNDVYFSTDQTGKVVTTLPTPAKSSHLFKCGATTYFAITVGFWEKLCL